MVEKEWLSVPTGASPMGNWQNKIRHLRSYLRGWPKNMSSVYKSEKVLLTSIIDTLDLKAESTLLSDDERLCLKNANEELAKLRRDEDSKWAQRAKVKHVQEGGNNIKYFHLVANGKHRKKNFFQLEKDECTIVGQENLKTYISEYRRGFASRPASCAYLRGRRMMGSTCFAGSHFRMPSLASNALRQTKRAPCLVFVHEWQCMHSVVQGSESLESVVFWKVSI
jgi:hypothetical protein